MMGASPPSQTIDIDSLIETGQWPLAEMLLRQSLLQDPRCAWSEDALGRIAANLGLFEAAAEHFRRAMALAPDWTDPAINLEAALSFADLLGDPSKGDPSESGPPRRLLIKAWGFGFWSDVFHVLSQLLLAEISQRQPMIHWGWNSLYRRSDSFNAFEHFFQPLPQSSLQDLENLQYLSDTEIWPPKWKRQNLWEGGINQAFGPYSRIAGLYLLNRPEPLIVSDFFTAILDLLPWIPTSHPLRGSSVEGAYRALAQKYLTPREEILATSEKFIANHLDQERFLAVHLRGLDKISEHNQVEQEYLVTQQHIEDHLDRFPDEPIFLMTDDLNLLDQFKGRYGQRIITNACQRASGPLGLHKLPDQDGVRLGQEVMVDTYTATRARAFIGHGQSNTSLAVVYLKPWPSGAVTLVGPNLMESYNLVLHQL